MDESLLIKTLIGAVSTLSCVISGIVWARINKIELEVRKIAVIEAETARISRLEIDVDKLQVRLGRAASHADMIQTVDRLQARLDTLQDNISNIRDHV